MGTAGNMSSSAVIPTANGLAAGYLELPSTSGYIIHRYYPVLDSTDRSLQFIPLVTLKDLDHGSSSLSIVTQLKWQMISNSTNKYLAF